MILPFLAINTKTEGLGNQKVRDTIKNVKLHIEKKKGELLKKLKQ